MSQVPVRVALLSVALSFPHLLVDRMHVRKRSYRRDHGRSRRYSEHACRVEPHRVNRAYGALAAARDSSAVAVEVSGTRYVTFPTTAARRSPLLHARKSL